MCLGNPGRFTALRAVTWRRTGNRAQLPRLTTTHRQDCGYSSQIELIS